MEAVTITCTDPVSVHQIMDAKGDGFGIMNTRNGLIVQNEQHPTGKRYPRGTVFWVGMGSIRAVWGTKKRMI